MLPHPDPTLASPDAPPPSREIREIRERTLLLCTGVKKRLRVLGELVLFLLRERKRSHIPGLSSFPGFSLNKRVRYCFQVFT